MSDRGNPALPAQSEYGGNPLRYGGWNFDWQNGRELAKAELSDGAADTTLTYAYDADGIRTSKTYKVETYEAHYTVKFVADGVTVKTMTVNDGYTLTDSDYPTVPTKAGYSGAWQQYTEAIHADITIQATYTALAQYTVKFVADGVTVKTMTVYEGYVLKIADYPAVPEKAGYNGSWRRRTTAITSDVTIQAVYTAIQYSVKFVVLRRTVKTLTVSDGYILHSGDYPTLPDGYGWTRNTDPIHSDITVTAIEGTSKPLVTFTGNGVTAKIMAVNRGYKLKDSDYPSVPEKKGYLGTWTKYTDAIYEDITVTATYKRSEIIKPPIRPTGVVASEDLPEPIEPQDVAEPDDTVNTSDATGNTVETLSNRPNQTLISTQTVTHEYLTLSGKVTRETVKKNGSVTDVMDFVYDESGRPFALNHSTNGGSSFTTYYYILNLQGDVVKLVTASGSSVATYEYDAWGKVLSATGSMADKNPLRYCGYYYDTETGFYYLQSRYYDPANRRFINADSYVSVDNSFVGVNLFAYCLNSPVGLRDDGGTSPYDFLGILDFYLIHKRVQEDVRRQYGWEMEVYVVGPNGKGRLDLYDVENNAYYEVKSAGVLLRQSGIKSLEKQLAKYDVALPTKYPDVCTPPSRGTTHVSGNFEYGFYDIEYKTTADGLILYTYTFNRKRARETALNALASLGVLAIVALAGLFGVPAEGALAPA